MIQFRISYANGLRGHRRGISSRALGIALPLGLLCASGLGHATPSAQQDKFNRMVQDVAKELNQKQFVSTAGPVRLSAIPASWRLDISKVNVQVVTSDQYLKNSKQSYLKELEPKLEKMNKPARKLVKSVGLGIQNVVVGSIAQKLGGQYVLSTDKHNPRTLFIIRDKFDAMPERSQRALLAHELTHAMQEQNAPTVMQSMMDQAKNSTTLPSRQEQIARRRNMGVVQILAEGQASQVHQKYDPKLQETMGGKENLGGQIKQFLAGEVMLGVSVIAPEMRTQIGSYIIGSKIKPQLFGDLFKDQALRTRMIQPSVQMVEKISLGDLQAARFGGWGFQAKTKWQLMTHPAQQREQILKQRQDLARSLPQLNVWTKSIQTLEANMAKEAGQQ